jgi:MoaA/NifB/PqqE/SkfB family radical SAM enzyme
MRASQQARGTLYPRGQLSDAIPLATPYYLCFEPTNLCNLKCHFCIQKDRELFSKLRVNGLGMMKMELFRKMVDDITKFPGKIKRLGIAGAGEPLLHPEISGMVEYVRKSQIAERIDITTNGVSLSPELNRQLANCGLTSMLISINGLTCGDYEANCGKAVDVEAIVENIGDLYRRKKDMLLCIKIADDGSLTDEYKQQFINTFGDICDIINIDRVIESGFWRGVNTQGTREYTIQGVDIRRRRICPYLFYSSTIRFDGSFYPCCQEYAGESPFGNIINEGFREMWEGGELKKARKMSLSGNQQGYPFCTGCTRYLFSSSSSSSDDLDPYADEILDRLVNEYGY